MKVLIYLNHPAHFHLFKNSIVTLKNRGHELLIYSKKKDVLDNLLIRSKTKYINVLKEGRKNSRISMIVSVAKRSVRLFNIVRKEKPDLIIATAFELAHIGRLMKVPFISVSEDDAEAIPLWSNYSYPFATYILSPTSCNNSKWENKSIKYPGYHELAYLHPNNFTPDINVCKKYMDVSKPYFVLRFSGLDAHHDKGVNGINDEFAKKLVLLLKPYGNVFITSERPLSPQLEPYRKAINPLDIHHVLAFAKIYIGDSQTMAAESGVLGTPFIRFNDFVGRLGYLNELENEYKLGFGFKPDQKKEMLAKVEELLLTNNLDEEFNSRKVRMLKDKIDLSLFLSWLIENYPQSIDKLREDPRYINRFK